MIIIKILIILIAILGSICWIIYQVKREIKYYNETRTIFEAYLNPATENAKTLEEINEAKHMLLDWIDEYGWGRIDQYYKTEAKMLWSILKGKEQILKINKNEL